LVDIAPTIYYAVLYEIMRGAMLDELGGDAYASFLTTHLFYRSYPKLIFNETTAWWDDISTQDIIETKEDIIVAAFTKAIAQLESEYGKNLNYWEWARTHTLEHPHPLGAVALLRPFFNVGPFPAPGGVETINNAGFPPNGDGNYKVSFGPAMRNLIDFNDVENAVSVLPTGNSGNIMSRHYDDQALLFVQGGFRKMMMNEEEIKSSENLLIMKPE
jgi:penicillin amidase